VTPAPPRTPRLDGKHCLVTGGAGFIGSHLVDHLLSAGATVRVLDNFATGRRENLMHCLTQIHLLEGDIRDADTTQRACQGIDIVFHQAALGSVPRSMSDPATSLAVNATGTANLFAAARDNAVSRVVYASSSSVYGNDERLPKVEGQEGQPLSPYALSKVMCEMLADTFARCFAMEFVGLRYFNVYGPRQDPSGPYAAVIPRFFAACAAGGAPTIFGDGEQSRDFTFVRDVVDANVLAGTASTAGAIAVNIGAGGGTTVTELAKAIIQVTGASVAPIYEAARAGDVRHSQADTTRAHNAIGFAATVNLAQGLALTHAGS
jgi:nucleoside-diphosphate-sugar epimerase